VEDHALMRKSIIQALEREADFTVCGQADNADDAIAAIALLKPDLVLTDIRLKSSSGLEVIKALHARDPELPIVATTMFDGLRNERLAREAGATGFASKQDGPEKLIATVHATLLASGKGSKSAEINEFRADPVVCASKKRKPNTKA
jgi:DNA-binding NarL/FixJ family response regulator